MSRFTTPPSRIATHTANYSHAQPFNSHLFTRPKIVISSGEWGGVETSEKLIKALSSKIQMLTPAAGDMLLEQVGEIPLAVAEIPLAVGRSH